MTQPERNWREGIAWWLLVLGAIVLLRVDAPTSFAGVPAMMVGVAMLITLRK